MFLLVLGKEYYKDSTCLDQKRSTWYPPTNCCSTTIGDWKQTLVAGKEHPAILAVRVERMTEEHMSYCCNKLVPKGICQGSDNGGKERRIAGVLCERHHTKHCELLGRRIPNSTGRRNWPLPVPRDNDRHPS